MVFLSACNTAPCYNDVNTVANALLEVGASAVTSSYLPLSVEESSVLYMRLIHVLSMAAKKTVHRNWLSFVSHALRTSFIMTPLVEGANDENTRKSVAQATTKVTTLSVDFNNRADLYRRLKRGEEVDGLKYNFANVVPHYLMYTTIGRADLIEFEVACQERLSQYKKTMGSATGDLQ